MLLISIGGTVYANLVMSTRLTCTANITSGSATIGITGWAINATNTIDANGNGIKFGDELKIENVIDGGGDVIGLNITVDPIFPNWYLNLTVDIHNTLDSIPVQLNRTIYYSNDTLLPGWDETDVAGLYDLFKIRYFDAWYNATTGELIPDITTHIIMPDETVTTLESLTFDGQDYQKELQDQTFYILVVITAHSPG